MIQETKSFISFTGERGLLLDESDHPKYPLKYSAFDHAIHKVKNAFGYVVSGKVGTRYGELLAGQYFSLKGDSTLFVDGLVVVIENLLEGYEPMDHIGGYVEDSGRLKYIDGCTDSLLIPPIKKGDGCLNHLHFPKDIDQTQHTHPSHRIGVVSKGEGECVTPFGNLPLVTGCIFVIKEWDGLTYSKGLDGKDYPLGQHAFKTRLSEMDVIAFHPDSDFGPEDEFHPMLNRTIVDGKPAAQHKDFDQFKT